MGMVGVLGDALLSMSRLSPRPGLTWGHFCERVGA